jgi:hypothetical protein
MIPANGGASEATAMPKQSGSATRNTTTLAERSAPRFLKELEAGEDALINVYYAPSAEFFSSSEVKMTAHASDEIPCPGDGFPRHHLAK